MKVFYALIAAGIVVLSSQGLRAANGYIQKNNPVENSTVMYEYGSNIGIGLTNAAANLEILGPSVPVLRLRSTSGAALDLQAWGSSYAALRTSSSYPLYLGVNGGTSMVLATSGYVGIGTTIPDQALEIKGGTTGGTYFTIGESNTKEAQFGWDGTNERSRIITYGHSYPIMIGNTWMFFETGGDVGVGTAFPSYKLDVSGTGRFTSDLTLDTDLVLKGADIKDAGGTSRITLTDNGNLELKEDNGVTRLCIETDGDVGIGDDYYCVPSWAEGYTLYVADFYSIYAQGVVSAAIFDDRTPYPADTAEAYAAVMSLRRLPEGEYDPDDSEHQLDHSDLHPFVAGKDGGRNLSATVSAQNEVIKDLINRIDALESQRGSVP